MDLVAIAGGAQVAVYRNDGLAHFGAPEITALEGLGSYALSDLDGDGALDIATATDAQGGEVRVLWNGGDGRFAGSTLVNQIEVPLGVYTADLDGDGDEDIALGRRLPQGVPAAGELDSGLAFLTNRGARTFGAVKLVDTDTEGIEAIVDIDGDDDVDIVSFGPGNRLAWMLNSGDGDFSQTKSIVLARTPNALATGDLDGEGRRDFVIASGGELDGAVEILRNPPRQLDRDRDGVVDTCASPFRRGDCDGDGQVARGVSDALFLLNFNFQGGAPRPPCLASCDVDADGRVAGAVTDAVYLLMFAFLGGPPPLAPFPDCGPGEMNDVLLGCQTPPCLEQ